MNDWMKQTYFYNIGNRTPVSVTKWSEQETTRSELQQSQHFPDCVRSAGFIAFLFSAYNIVDKTVEFL